MPVSAECYPLFEMRTGLHRLDANWRFSEPQWLLEKPVHQLGELNLGSPGLSA